jgi:acetolactate synthase small subunit
VKSCTRRFRGNVMDLADNAMTIGIKALSARVSESAAMVQPTRG